MADEEKWEVIAAGSILLIETDGFCVRGSLEWMVSGSSLGKAAA